MSWYTDRSRYLDGFACPWKRLLKFHAFGTGIERAQTYAPLQTGIAVHSALERILRGRQLSGRDLGQEDVAALLAPVSKEYEDKVATEFFEDPGITLGQQLGLVEALAHGFTRISLPWLWANHELYAVEEELTVEIAPGLMWMARPDFVTKNRMTGAGEVHDFKTASSWSPDDTSTWSDSVQLMMNAVVASRVYGFPIDHYYIHVLVKGRKNAPSVLTHAYVDATGNLSPEWHPKTTRAYVPDIMGQDRGAIGHWVWTMPEQVLAKQVIVIGPFQVDHAKVNRLITGIARNEAFWEHNLKAIPDWDRWEDPAFQRYLDALFPRTFACYEYGGRRCQFYQICHRPNLPFTLSFLGSRNWKRRTPHHKQEVIPEFAPPSPATRE